MNFSTPHTSTIFIRNLTTNSTVGSTPGEGGVSGSGSATYSIPIAVPPGTNGVVPQVSIVYNSQGGTGIAGYGWSIAGLSAITRAPQNNYFDGSVSAVDLSTADRFMLDGSRLILKQGTYGAANSEYGTETENFAKVTAYGTAGGGPEYFKILTKDGVLMEFGNTTDSRFLAESGGTAMFWRLNKILNPDGNYIKFVYTNADRDSRISEIQYTGNENVMINLGAGNVKLDTYNVLKFSYKVRKSGNTFSDIRTSYEGGSSVVNKYLLDEIVVNAEGALVKKYQFKYGQNNINSLLNEVVEIGSNGTSALNATVFKYGDAPTGFTRENGPTPPSSSDFFSGDFDGNGKSDMVVARYDPLAYPTSDGWKVDKRYNSFSVFRDGDSSKETPLVTLASGTVLRPNIFQGNNYSFMSSDFNGDGLDDLLTAQISSVNFSGGTKPVLSGIAVHYGKLSGSGLTTDPLTFSGQGFPTDAGYNSCLPPNLHYIYTGDFDGDGKKDFFTLLQESNGVQSRTQYYHTFNNPESGIPYDIYNIGKDTDNSWLANTFATAKSIYILDFNGDGKDDVMTVNNGSTNIYTFTGFKVVNFSGIASFKLVYTSTRLLQDVYNNAVFFGDFNGDGKTDILYRGKNDSGQVNSYPWYKETSTGKDFIPSGIPIMSTNGALPESDLFQVADFNGDGRSDIYYQKKQTGGPDKIYMHYSTNDSFYSTEYTTPAVGNSYTQVGSSFDLNGDGRAEMVMKGTGATLTVISPLKNGQENLLLQTQNGMGLSTSWNYKSLSEGGTFYSKGAVTLNDHPLVNVGLPMFAVSDYSVQNGVGGLSTVAYAYGNAKMHRDGKGFLGFGAVTANNMALGVKTVSENDFNTIYYTAIPKKVSTYLSGSSTPFGETITENAIVTISGTKRFWVKTNNVTETRSLEGRKVRTVNIYDEANGNVATSTVTKSTIDNTNVEVAETVSLYAAYVSAIKNRPTEVTVTRTRTGSAPFVAKSTFGYDTQGLLTSQTEFSNTDKKVVTAYGYYPSGSLKKTTITGYNGTTSLTPRRDSLGYDIRYRYPTVTRNAMDYETGASYDPKWGKALTSTSMEGLTTTHLYDVFGRVTTTTFPGPYTVSNTDSWNTPSGSGWISKQETLAPTSGRPDTKTWFDILGRKVRTETEGFNGQTIIQTQSYDARGNEFTASQAYMSSETPLTTNNLYDSYNRLASVNRGVLGTTTFEYTLVSGNLKVTTTAPAGISSKTTDASGLVIKAEDNINGAVDYTYYSHGGAKEIKVGGTIVSSSEYDANGRQTKLTDANAGVTVYNHNALGELISQTNALNKTHTREYNKIGQITSRTGPEGVTSFIYGTTNGSGELKAKLKQVNGFADNHQTIYAYNDKGRITSVNEKVNDSGDNALDNHITSYTYNQFGDELTVTYPSGLVITSEYDAYGYLKYLKRGTKVLYTTGTMNGQGQVMTYSLGNLKSSTITYVNGFPTGFQTDGIQSLNMAWNYAKGTLTSRTDARTTVNKTETFLYDGLNRLTTTTIGSNPSFGIQYSGNGNITKKTDAGDYQYHPTKINAATKVENTVPFAIAPFQQDITYTDFMQPATVKENGYELTYTYNADYNRIKSVTLQNTNIVNTRYYFDGYEKDVTGGTERYVQYINSPIGLVSIITSQGGAHTEHYSYTDHLGSIVTVTNDGAGIEAQMSFDAWGRRRNTTSWELLSPTANTGLPVWLYRGYTQHEHLDNFGLINMNGRMYDPVLGRMLSPDNYVADAHDTQAYNRYSYALNNPLTYVDPDGNLPVFLFMGMMYGGIQNGISYVEQGKNFLDGFWRGMITGGLNSFASVYTPASAITGAAYGAATGTLIAGIGSFLNGGSSQGGSTALMGAFSGAATGFSRGKEIGINPVTGNGDVIEYMKMKEVATMGEQWSSTEKMREHYDNTIGKRDNMTIKQVEKIIHANVMIATDDIMEQGLMLTSFGEIYHSHLGFYAGGITKGKYVGGLLYSAGSSIYIAPAAAGYSLVHQNGIFKHEFMHAWHWTKNPIKADYKNFSERATSAFSMAYGKFYGLDISNTRREFNHVNGSAGTPLSYSWKEFNKLIPTWLK
ncbi:FG-GAP-like repeat-containing protein [Dyadobacter sp. CY261]|uniref:FG-GAP-like repeat-containing protein n=1 Tax=Dyadobacter sp. CY261 TaxID=2907203 RepID=UPI001F1C1135|nr:FG-GAP-like repeat-containing protein [Dyadobacter sp. CY261]MCF0072129.1 FG-GAP-like repeat-containing protein [Dyadobacter sp. CY261]